MTEFSKMLRNWKWILFLRCPPHQIWCVPYRSWPVSNFIQTFLLKYWCFCLELKTLMGFQNLESFLVQVNAFSQSFWLRHHEVSRRNLRISLFLFFSKYHDCFESYIFRLTQLILPFTRRCSNEVRLLSSQYQSW